MDVPAATSLAAQQAQAKQEAAKTFKTSSREKPPPGHIGSDSGEGRPEDQPTKVAL